MCGGGGGGGGTMEVLWTSTRHFTLLWPDLTTLDFHLLPKVKKKKKSKIFHVMSFVWIWTENEPTHSLKSGVNKLF